MLRLPHGLEVVGRGWFSGSVMEKLFIPNTVREFGKYAFGGCRNLREIIFEPDPQLETIGDDCFKSCRLEEVTIQRSVRSIGCCAFQFCYYLHSLTFEEGSQLEHVGKDVVHKTQLDEKDVEFPKGAKVEHRRE